MSSDSRSVLVHTSRTPSICGIDGCECCPPGAVYCDCHESYNDVEAEPVVAMWGWDCACGAAPPRRWADYWECIAAGHAHQIEDHGAIRAQRGRYLHELSWGVRNYAESV